MIQKLFKTMEFTQKSACYLLRMCFDPSNLRSMLGNMIISAKLFFAKQLCEYRPQACLEIWQLTSGPFWVICHSHREFGGYTASSSVAFQSGVVNSPGVSASIMRGPVSTEHAISSYRSNVNELTLWNCVLKYIHSNIFLLGPLFENVRY